VLNYTVYLAEVYNRRYIESKPPLNNIPMKKKLKMLGRAMALPSPQRAPPLVVSSMDVMASNPSIVSILVVAC
jgi:hypothetical protein